MAFCYAIPSGPYKYLCNEGVALIRWMTYKVFREVPGTEKEVRRHPLAPLATDNGMVLELEQIHVFTSAATSHSHFLEASFIRPFLQSLSQLTIAKN